VISLTALLNGDNNVTKRCLRIAASSVITAQFPTTLTYYLGGLIELFSLDRRIQVSGYLYGLTNIATIIIQRNVEDYMLLV
jgi:hypothetical protein